MTISAAQANPTTSTVTGRRNDLTGAAYFAKLQRALGDAGHCQPVLVIDKNRLDHNLDTLAASVPSHMDVRIVAKSLPSIDLLNYVTWRLGTNRLMTFNLPMLTTLAKEMPTANQLLGKPFPVAAAARFYAEEGTQSAAVQWLIDTSERLDQYAALGARLGMALNVSLELDVGLHRGGFSPDWKLRMALRQIANSDFLNFGGFMGYEAHLAKIPTMGGLRSKAFDQAMGLYEEAVAIAEETLGTEGCADAILNSAGSLTYQLHRQGSIANEMSIGTALLKGTDFDTDLLGAFMPAAFIATPVIKVLPSTRLPGMDFMDGLPKTRSNPDHALFVHGGHWLAEPHYPDGLAQNSLYGRSSNQEMLNVPAGTAIEPDDFVFLRPTQTEAVLMQFGDLAVFDNGAFTDTWSPLPPST